VEGRSSLAAYVETYNHLTLGLADDRYDQQRNWKPIFRPFLTTSAKDVGADVRDFLDGFPRQYLKITPKGNIAEHFNLSRSLNPCRW